MRSRQMLVDRGLYALSPLERVQVADDLRRVNRLPHTVDGVPIQPGDHVWCPHATEEGVAYLLTVHGIMKRLGAWRIQVDHPSPHLPNRALLINTTDVPDTSCYHDCDRARRHLLQPGITLTDGSEEKTDGG